MLSSFSCAYWPSAFLPWRNVYLGILPIFFNFVVVIIELYELYVYFGNQRPVGHIACNMFSHSEGCLFVLFMVSFVMEKLVSLIGSHLFIFVFISISLGDWPKKSWYDFMSENVLPLMSSKSFTVSCLIQSLSHF